MAPKNPEASKYLLETGPSLRLIDEESYKCTYNRIKNDYGREIALDWTEKSDPLKVVFEDCGIAAYILELFRKFQIKPTKVADLGCGNGLLIYLLAKEGISGVGFDVRKRKIWEKLRPIADLQECSIDPTSSKSLEIFEGVDLLIGNHSDELTPWIPVLAARLKCNFFLLPCCPFDFFSKFSKHSRKELQGVGVSDTYYAFVEDLIKKLGFDLHIDRLRIPSRKKICFFGTIPDQGLPANISEVIDQLLEFAKRVKPNFVARPAVQENKNCSKLPREFQLSITRKIAEYLLQKEEKSSDSEWSPGALVPVPELGPLLSDEDKKMLKDQNGGLQTLLKNHHQAFYTRNRHVGMRDWREAHKVFLAKPQAKSHFQLSPCWFFANHPQGCPVEAATCPFSHESDNPL
ncbi:adoMet-dependent methyltransferase domain-containing protein [Ditylenchus destructor]|nr:adoMet-dependent methyltransferase domain-containing protein [Ditylenchus destructor]